MSASGPTEPMYYIRSHGKVEGPLDLARARSLVRRGRLARHDEVSLDRVNWRRASEFPELFATQVQRKMRTSIVQVHAQTATTEETVPPPAAEEGQWFFSSQDTQQGPVSSTELVQMIKGGALEPDALVWTQGMPQWLPWPQVPAFQHLVPRAPAPAAPPAPRKQLPSPVPGTAVLAVEEDPDVEPPRISPTALISFILGICFSTAMVVVGGTAIFSHLVLFLIVLILGGIGSILGIILGHLGLASLRRQENLAGRNLALAGMVMGYAGVGLVVVILIITLAYMSLQVNP